MTITVLNNNCPLESLKLKSELVESNITLLDSYIAKLVAEKNQLQTQRHGLLSQLQSHRLNTQAAGRLPMEHLASFLSVPDMFSLMTVSRHYRQKCLVDEQMLLAHLVSPSLALSDAQAERLVDSICLPAIESIHLDAKKKGSIPLLHALASKSHLLTSLTSIRVSAAAETGQFLIDLVDFFNGLPSNQITSFHLSGLRTMEIVNKLVMNQVGSIEHFRVDYFVNGHERDVSQLFEMPNLISLVYDVADVVDVEANLVLNLLNSIKRKT